MSDDNKNLKDDLDDMLDNAKDGANAAADKASEMASDAKEKVKEVYEDAKEATEEFVDDAKEVLSDGKNVAIIAHFWWIGWIIALVMNGGDKKTEYGSFYIRQMLGLLLLGTILSFIPVVNLFAWIPMLILWILSLVGALGGNKKLTPVVGQYFQDWFKSL